ncbi:uncharacterized protein LOC111391806 [Olea europaea var. sylvestris]|uniref:uncharacterized protein LOC111391806 n=1 Tax=Olea europaea var. sylvestris TaxID=158386 RepID=UPI000C1D781D|nr:uncharacterized protein LOC111391806 [Olea europaea var. sylvestris]
MQTGQMLSISPSFNSYSNSKIVEIADRVVEEFNGEEFNSEELCEELYQKTEEENEADSKNDVDEEFEFAFVTSDSEFSSSISADEIFYNGQIRPVFPIFNRGLWIGNSDSSSKAPISLPLRKLFIQSEKTSSSPSEVDDLDGVPAETYCTWRPKSGEAEGRCKKSNSTGSTKRCKFKNLLNRSHSDGDQGTLDILTPSKQKENEKIKKSLETPVLGGGKAKAEALNDRNGGDRPKSYLPYRKDLVGFFL